MHREDSFYGHFCACSARRVELSTTTPSSTLERQMGLKHLVSLGSERGTSRSPWGELQTNLSTGTVSRAYVCVFVYSSSSPHMATGARSWVQREHRVLYRPGEPLHLLLFLPAPVPLDDIRASSHVVYRRPKAAERKPSTTQKHDAVTGCCLRGERAEDLGSAHRCYPQHQIYNTNSSWTASPSKVSGKLESLIWLLFFSLMCLLVFLWSWAKPNFAD